MKRTLLIILATVTLLTLIPFFASAKTLETETPSLNAEVVYLEDGNYLVTIIEEVASNQTMQAQATAAATTKTVKKATVCYNSSNVAQCSLTVEATFSITMGSKVSCTSVKYQSASYDNNWSVESVNTSSNNSSTSQASGTASGKFVKRLLGIKINTINASVTVNCDKNGNYW